MGESFADKFDGILNELADIYNKLWNLQTYDNKEYVFKMYNKLKEMQGAIKDLRDFEDDVYETLT